VSGVCAVCPVRPAQVQLSAGQQLCVVCHDVANGIHFGAITCEGCKVSMSPPSDVNAAASMSCLGGTAAAAPLPFKPGDSVLCGSCSLVTPYYCRLGDLLCCIVVGLSFFVYYYAYVYFCRLRCLILPL